MADNLETTLKINSALKARSAVLAKHEQSLKNQIALQIGLNEAIKKNKLDQVIKSIEETKEALENLGEQADTTSNQFEKGFGEVREELNKGKKGIFGWRDALDKVKNKFPTLTKVGLAFIEGFADGLKFQINLLKSLGGLFLEVGKGIFNVGIAIASIPFKMLDGFFALANKLRHIWEENARQIEEVRKEFGDLAGATANQVVGAFNRMSGELANTGLSVYRVFGNYAERIQYVRELFKGLGATVHLFGQELSDNIEIIGAFQKGLGLAADDIQAIKVHSKVSGKSIIKSFQEMTNMSVKLGKRFNLDQKLISRDMGFMSKDVSHFGTMSIKSMGEAITYTRSLGLEVKVLAGIVDAFLDFESAATNVAKLSQVFGTNIDTMQIMRDAAKDPAKAFDTIRQKMFEAGRTSDKMNLAELRFLATTTKMTEQEAKLAFSMKSRGKSLAEIKNQAKSADKSQMSLEDTIKNLSGAIERMIKPLPQLNGFFDAFVKGFSRGILLQKDFRKALSNLYQSAFQVGLVAMEIGQNFINAFPGIKKFLDGFNELFKPAKYKKLVKEISQTFSIFFEMIGDPKTSPADAIKVLFNNFGLSFDRFFGENGEAIKKIKDGVLSIAKTFRDIAIGSIPLIKDGIIEILNSITKFIKNPKQFFDTTAVAKDGAMGFISPLIIAIKDASTDPNLRNAVKDFAITLKNIVLEKVEEIWNETDWKTKGLIIGGIIGPPLIGGLIAGFGILIPSLLLKGIGKIFSMSFAKGFANIFLKMAKPLEKSMTFLFNGIGRAFKSIGPLLKGSGKLFAPLLKILGGAGKFALKKIPIVMAVMELFNSIVRIKKEWNSSKGALENIATVFKEIAFGAINVATFGFLDMLIPNIREKFDFAIDYWKDKLWGLITWVTGDPGDPESRNIFVRIADKVSKKWNEFIPKIKELGKDIYEAIKSPFSRFVDWVKEIDFEKIGNSIYNGIKIGLDKLDKVLKGNLIIGPFIESVKKLLDMNSPSGVFMDIGHNISDGMTIGLNNLPFQMEHIAETAVLKSKTKLKKGMVDVYSLTKEIDKISNITPSVDINSRVNNDLKVKDQKYIVEYKNMNINVNLNVIMEADQVADAVIKTKKVISSGKTF